MKNNVYSWSLDVGSLHVDFTLHSSMMYMLIGSLLFFSCDKLAFLEKELGFYKSDQLMCRTNYKSTWEKSFLEMNNK